MVVQRLKWHAFMALQPVVAVPGEAGSALHNVLQLQGKQAGLQQ